MLRPQSTCASVALKSDLIFQRKRQFRGAAVKEMDKDAQKEHYGQKRRENKYRLSNRTEEIKNGTFGQISIFPDRIPWFFNGQ